VLSPIPCAGLFPEWHPLVAHLELKIGRISVSKQISPVAAGGISCLQAIKIIARKNGIEICLIIFITKETTQSNLIKYLIAQLIVSFVQLNKIT
jgi:hypothetical protein